MRDPAEIMIDGVPLADVLDRHRQYKRDILAGLGAPERGLTLTGVDFSGHDLSGLFAPGSDLSGCRFTGADLSRSYFGKSSFKQADFTHATLDGMSGQDSCFDGACFEQARLFGTVGRQSSFRGARFEEATVAGDFSAANLSGADLEGANFNGANLAGADLSDVALEGVIGEGELICSAQLGPGCISWICHPSGAVRVQVNAHSVMLDDLAGFDWPVQSSDDQDEAHWWQGARASVVAMVRANTPRPFRIRG